jgi:hypothetical protein
VRWEKKGLLLRQAPPPFSHASHPTAAHLGDDDYLIAFCGRNASQASHVFLVRATLSGGDIQLFGDPVLAMTPGSPGEFDCDGLLTCNFVRDGDSLFLYYCGWQNLPNGLWHCDSGRLKVFPREMRLEREFVGPILGRRRDIPLYAVTTAVHKFAEGDWAAWYNRGLSWSKKGDTWIPKYGIHYAHSTNGIDWICEQDLIIPFADEREHSFGRPTVLVAGDRFHMWFGARGAGGDPAYRIGYAASLDGRHWVRRDDLSGIGVSDDGWDSEAVTYPSVVLHHDRLYMLYNGNHYGRSGFGYATSRLAALDELTKLAGWIR